MSPPVIKADIFTGFYYEGLGPIFPILFVTVACGAISGFHSIVASGTSSKQLEKETDARFIGYGGMLTEGVLAMIALITAIMLTSSEFAALKEPGVIFASGFGALAGKLGIPVKTGASFAALAIAAFALTTLDTATRLGRYTFQEFFDTESRLDKFLSDRFTASFITVAAALALAVNKGGTMSIWPLFGTANQMLGALALLTVAAYMSKIAVKGLFVKIPAVIMFAVTISAMVFMIVKNISAGNYPLAFIAVLLLITAVYITMLSFRQIFPAQRGAN